MEVQPYGIRVVLIEPGDFHTGITAHRRRARAAQHDSVYKERFARSLAIMEADETDGPPPTAIAYLLERILSTPSPRLRYPVGPVAERLAIALKRIVPHRLFELVVMRYYRLL